MIQILERQAGRENQAMRAMFAARKSVFVDLLKWDVPVVDGQYEVDQFDTIHASYIILTDWAGRHLASARLLRTDRPHILDTLFEPLCSDPPRGPHISEITRFCLDRQLTAAERREARNILVTALAVYAREHGISQYSAVAELDWYQQVIGFGWRCEPLGLPVEIGSQMLAALSIFIGDDTLDRLAEAGIYSSATQIVAVPAQAA